MHKMCSLNRLNNLVIRFNRLLALLCNWVATISWQKAQTNILKMLSFVQDLGNLLEAATLYAMMEVTLEELFKIRKLRDSFVKSLKKTDKFKLLNLSIVLCLAVIPPISLINLRVLSPNLQDIPTIMAQTCQSNRIIKILILI